VLKNKNVSVTTASRKPLFHKKTNQKLQPQTDKIKSKLHKTAYLAKAVFAFV
jgi:hypothetical protein